MADIEAQLNECLEQAKRRPITSTSLTCVLLGGFIMSMVALASIHELGPRQQLLVKDPAGYWVQNGPWMGVVITHRPKEIREASLVATNQYAVLKNVLTGVRTHHTGPQLLFPGPYDQILSVLPKILVLKGQYVRLQDRANGTERVLVGPQSVVPRPTETTVGAPSRPINGAGTWSVIYGNCTTVQTQEEGACVQSTNYPQDYPNGDACTIRGVVGTEIRTAAFNTESGFDYVYVDGVNYAGTDGPSQVTLERGTITWTSDGSVTRSGWKFCAGTGGGEPVHQATFLEVDTALLVEDRNTGRRHLVTEEGLYVPGAYENIMEVRRLIHVLPHEAVVVRDQRGRLAIHSGAQGNGTGMAFFLPPYHEIVEMHWSNFSKPPEEQTTAKERITKVDMRGRKIFFQYEVRTSDNVKLVLAGTIFWHVQSLPTLINATSDPEGDVWHHARSALIEAVSNVTLQRFMSGFNDIVMQSFHRQAQDGFYVERGVEMESLEVTRFDCADEQTSQVLQQIIQETTNRINRLTAQESTNEVRSAAMTANISLEVARSELIRTQSENHRLQSEIRGEAEGMKLVHSANAFIGGLTESVPNVSNRVELYRLHQELRGRNADTENLASGSAHLFLTPQDLNLRLDTASAGTASGSSAQEL
jgi:hypothetical protein